MSTKAQMYRVIFQSEGQQFEIYARSVSQGGLFGFVEIGELVFGGKSALLIDPGEEKLQEKFSGVSSFFVPIHAVLRIDVVSEKGTAKATPVSGDGDKVTPFPVYSKGKET